jgi:hypothetical protein
MLGGDFFRSLELLPLRLHLQLTLNFGGEGVVSDRKGLNISSIYGMTGWLSSKG